MKYHQWLAIAFIGLPLLATANDMSKSFNEAREVGKSSNSNAQSILRDFQPSKEFDNFQARPAESGHYQGITGNPDLNGKGMQALSNSEIGKSIRESTINNPKVNISEESDFIQNSNHIRKNADFISGIANSKQCVNQVLSKSVFTNHFCEKDQAIDAICKEEENIKWITKQEYKEKEFVLNGLKLNNYAMLVDGKKPEYWVCLRWNSRDNCVSWGYTAGNYHLNTSLSFNIPEAGKLVKYKIEVVKQRDNRDLQFKEHLSRTKIGGKIGGINKDNEIGINVEQGQTINADIELGYGYHPSRISHRVYVNSNVIAKALEFKITFTIGVMENIPSAITEKIYACSHNVQNAIKIFDECTIRGGNRTFVKEGKTISIYSDCWERTEKYLVSEESDNECKNYDSNPNCTVSERECILKMGNDCIRHRVKYQCSKTVKTDGYVCGDKFFCSDGSCSDLEGSVNSDFGHAVSQLATLAQAGKDVSLDDVNLRAFSGRPMFCRKSGFGFSDCCKDSGWGHKAGLAQCNSEENALGQAKEKKLVIFVGTYCDKRVLKKCVRRKSSYCVFDNKLARIIQAQGRSGQLGLGFGGASSPDCRGLNVEELQRIDFNAMDYSDFYEELEANKQIPDKDQLIEYMRKSITDQLQQ